MKQVFYFLIMISSTLLDNGAKRVVVAQDGLHSTRDKYPELPELVRNWAGKLGGELWHFGELVTRRNMVIDSFKHTQLVQEDGASLLKDITEKIKKMMDEKVHAVRRIMEVAENVAAAQGDIVDDTFDYYKAKDLVNSEDPVEEVKSTVDASHHSDTLHHPNFNNNEENAEFSGAEAVRQRKVGRGFAADINNYVNDGGHVKYMMMDSDDDSYQHDQEQNDNTQPDMGGPAIGVEEEIIVDSETMDESQQKILEEDDVEDEEDAEEETSEDIGGDDASEEAMASLKPPEDRRRMGLYPNPHFFNIPVNTNLSAVHVPSNVYDRAQEVIKGIKWSEELDKTFRHNYKDDPSLSWQYFGSSTGFMRQFPALIWKQEPIDLFDCRTRSWFIEAASSPKDIVILIDRSGSMMGMRREIAKHVVNNILDTLGNNDYVNIYTFSNTTEPLIDCFDGLLVQANLANVRMFKDSMFDFKTEQIANFSNALTTAFKLFADYRDNRPGEGAQCNQAIMLVTDGVYYNFKEIFKEYNWKNLPFMPVRVFTYLIGREVSDVREVKWMACANQGFYVHLSTYAEVREQVLQYIPVMARPMVLNPTLKPNPTWSPIYADVTDPKLTNWLWVMRERNRQRDTFMLYMKNRTIGPKDFLDKRFVYQQRKKHDVEGGLHSYRLMTSVSLPVYDKRPNATKIANLLGVAGTDVPLEYIQRLMLPYRIGVNGYAFIVTNNGYLLIHPDLRPVFQGILKPAYNRVDLMEVELLDDDSEPREFADKLQEFRKAVINQTTGGAFTLQVKTHLDDMNRIMFSTRKYHYMGIDNSPFSVVVALPDKYGEYRVQHSVNEDVHRMVLNNVNVTQFFSGNWTIHPDWHYCRYFEDGHTFLNAEEELHHFLQKMEKNPPWKWTRDCDRKLVCMVVADAKKTAWFNQNISSTNKEENGHEFIKRFGITVAFLATHSGLTRWQDFPQNTGGYTNSNIPQFHQMHNRAVDEVWYRRAVEQHYLQPRSFVYSVPFEAEYDPNKEDVLVTATHAIFQGNKTRKAPAAVVGFQFYHSALLTLFQNITNSCGEIKNCKRTCKSAELYCLVLDDSGFVIVSYDDRNTGIFLGEFRSDIMDLLVQEMIYTRTRMYDYQATCFPNIQVASPAAPSFNSPAKHLSSLLKWTLSTLLYLMNSVIASPDKGLLFEDLPPALEVGGEDGDETDEDDDNGDNYEEDAPRAFEKEFDHGMLINKTQPESCDKHYYLHSLIHYTARNITSSGYNKSMTGNWTFIVQPVVGSNMVLLVINMLIPEMNGNGALEPMTPEPREIEYGNMTRQCYIAHFNNFPRRNYMSCINRSIHEKEIELCGRGSVAVPLNTATATVCSLLAFFIFSKLAIYC